MPEKHTTYLNDGWQFIETARANHGEWLAARVPGHVHLDLVTHGIIGHPFYRMQEIGAQWVDQTDWSYRCKINFTPDKELPKRVLRFEGLDTVCTIRLNGEVIAEHDNMHTVCEIDVSRNLREGENEIRVDFKAAAPVGEALRAEYFKSEGLPETTKGFPERAFVRKAQYMFGWDWGPRLVSCGIWRPVSLVEYASRIKDVHVVPTYHPERDCWTVKVASKIDGKAAVRHTLYDESMAPIAELDADGEMEVAAPKLWWPHDLGEPTLHFLETTLVGKDEDDEMDRRLTRFGFRTVRLLQDEDAFGTSFQFEINGVPIFARGANWIPGHSFPSCVDARMIRQQLERAVEMNMNMIRVWGGGLHETDEFYGIADEMGLLIWQDFAYGCSYVPDTGRWLEIAREEAIDNVVRLRNHPSLVHWCGNNENLVMWHSKWGGPTDQPKRFYGHNIFEDVIPKVLAEYDPTRPYTSSSPWGGEHCGCDEIGDQHNWSVWHGGDWPKYADSRGRFISEFGFAAAPSMSVWEKWIDADDWAHDSPVVRWHDKTEKGFERFTEYVGFHYPESQSLEDWTYFSQLNQRDALRFGIEHYRQGDFCKGTLIWQINDCWPVQSWALIDCEGNWKAAAYEVRRVFKDHIVTIGRKGSIVRVCVVNDGLEPIDDSLLVVMAKSTITGEIFKLADQEVCLYAGERKAALEIDIAGLNATETFIHAEWFGYDAAWRFCCEPKEVKLALPDIKMAVNSDGDLDVQSDLPIFDLMLFNKRDTAAFAGNFISLVDEAPVTVELNPGFELGTVMARSLAGYHRVRMLRGPLA